MRIKCILILFLICSCFTIYAQDVAKPRNGEGVHSFLRRNNRVGNDYYEQFIELNRKKLGKNLSLQLGVEYKLPPLKGTNKKSSSATTGKEPLFGSKYENYTIKSSKLKGACFYLVSGHGGPDCGAIGKVGNIELHEDEYAYDITLRLARALLEEGATVHILVQDAKDGIRDDKYLANSKRETCMGETIPLNQKKRLTQRSDKINELSSKSKAKYQRAVEIHLDSRSEKQRIDVFFYYSPKKEASKKLANTLRETFDEHYKKHQPNRGFTGTVSARGGLHTLREVKPTTVFVELGNIQNSFDQRRFIDYNNRQALANWLCRGLIKDYENTKKK